MAYYGMMDALQHHQHMLGTMWGGMMAVACWIIASIGRLRRQDDFLIILKCPPVGA